jgi:antitoxin (DNA-binding transcriptional repressor) of toxin-antitoxin stability system
MGRTISATEAAREFSRVLDDLEHHHETVYYIERHGRPVARLEADTGRRSKWRDVRAALLSAPRPDPEFAADLAEIRATQSMTPDPWEAS